MALASARASRSASDAAVKCRAAKTSGWRRRQVVGEGTALRAERDRVDHRNGWRVADAGTARENPAAGTPSARYGCWTGGRTDPRSWRPIPDTLWYRIAFGSSAGAAAPAGRLRPSRNADRRAPGIRCSANSRQPAHRTVRHLEKVALWIRQPSPSTARWLLPASLQIPGNPGPLAPRTAILAPGPRPRHQPGPGAVTGRPGRTLRPLPVRAAITNCPHPRPFVPSCTHP